MYKRIRIFIALATAVMCLASGMMSVMPVKAAAKESCMHETTVIRTSVFVGYADISANGHSEVFDRTYKCAACGVQVGGVSTVSISCGHTVVQYSDLGHELPISGHPYVTFCKCGYSQEVLIPCNWRVTGFHAHP